MSTGTRETVVVTIKPWHLALCITLVMIAIGVSVAVAKHAPASPGVSYILRKLA